MVRYPARAYFGGNPIKEGSMRWVCVLLVLVACSSPTTPEIPPGAVEVSPRAAYTNWWAEVMEESGIVRDISRVRWFSVPGDSWYSPRFDADIEGLWVRDGRIYIAETRRGNKNLVKHEMLHELLRGDFAHAHPLFEVYTLTTCSDPFLCP